jgi:hypothetical protein
MTLRSFLPWAGLVLSLVNGLPAELSAQLPIVRIGVVVDGPWERNREILDLFQSEIRTLTRDEFDGRFPEDKIVEGDWTLDTGRLAAPRLTFRVLDPHSANCSPWASWSQCTSSRIFGTFCTSSITTRGLVFSASISTRIRSGCVRYRR